MRRSILSLVDPSRNMLKSVRSNHAAQATPSRWRRFAWRMHDLPARWMQAMRCGDYQAAWQISDRVLAARDRATRDDPSLPYHLRWVWDGSPLQNRDVLVRCYHGLGDSLQFARFLSPLRACAASVTLEVQPELLGLIEDIDAQPFILDKPSRACDCDIEIMELCHALRLPPQSAPPPPLHAPPINLPRGSIGLCWQGGSWDPDRSIPHELLLDGFAGRTLLALQQLGDAPGRRFLNPTGAPARIQDTARLIAGLDLVVTVDTMVAHLAGSLGRPTWLLLKHAADWRWMRERADSPWYPSLRLIRQRAPGDWGSVMEQVVALLAAR